MRKRLFFALPITSGLYPKIYNLEKEINQKMKINWLPLENLHLTLLFLGWLEINELTKIIEIFKKTINENKNTFKILKLKITKIDYGPPGKKRMIWLYLEKNKQLEEMKNILENNLIYNKINFQKESKDLLPHINLARLKSFNRDIRIRKDLNWGVIFNNLNLYESYLEKPFARYEILSSVKLFFS